MVEFTDVSTALFSRCAEQLQYDEIVHNHLFDTKSAMTSLEVSGPRLDSHFIAEGHHSIADAVASGLRSPAAALSTDELLGVCGRFVDLQVSRILGYDAYTNILTCAYVLKGAEIGDAAARFMFRCFATACYHVEDFAYNLALASSAWRYNIKYAESLAASDLDELERELPAVELPAVLRKLAQFEIDLARFICDPFGRELSLDVAVPEQTNDIGVDKFLRYRDSPPSNAPAKGHIPEHSESIEVLRTFVKEVAEVKKLFSSEMGLAELILTIQKWNEECDHISFVRFIAFYLIFGSADPKLLFNKVTLEQYLVNELKRFHVHQKFISHPKFSEFTSIFSSVLVTLVQKLISPMATYHLSLSDSFARIWAYVQFKGYELQTEAVQQNDFPRCTSKEHQVIASNVLPLWSSNIASILLILVFRWGYMSDLYSDKNIHIMMYCSEVATKTAMFSLRQIRIADAVYRTVNNVHKKSVRNEKDVNKKIKDKTAEELFYEILNDFYNCLLTLYKLINHWNCFEVKRGNYFNEENVFKCLVYPVNEMAHISKLEYSDFKKSLDIGQFKGFEQLLIKEATMNFNKVKNGIKDYRNACGSLPEELTVLLRSAISNNICATKLTAQSKVRLVKPPKYPYPYFEIAE